MNAEKDWKLLVPGLAKYMIFQKNMLSSRVHANSKGRKSTYSLVGDTEGPIITLEGKIGVGCS